MVTLDSGMQLEQRSFDEDQGDKLDISQTYEANCETPRDIITSEPGVRIRQMLVRLLDSNQLRVNKDSVSVETVSEYDRVNELLYKIFNENKTAISSNELLLIQDFLSANNIEEKIERIYSLLELKGTEGSISKVGSIIRGERSSLSLINFLKKYFRSGKEAGGEVILPNFEDYQAFDYLGDFDTDGNALALKDLDFVGTVKFEESGIIDENDVFSKVDKYGMAKIWYPGKGYGVVRVTGKNNVEIIVDFQYNNKSKDKLEVIDGKVIKKGKIKNKVIYDYNKNLQVIDTK